MRNLSLVVLILALATSVWAAPSACPTTGTYQDLLNLNAAGGCIIFDKIFSNFSYVPTATGGAAPVLANQTTFTVVSNFPSNLGFQFNWSSLSASANQSNDIFISYLITMAAGFPALISSAHADMTAATTGTGVASLGENLYIGCNSTTCPDVPNTSFTKSFSLVTPGGQTSFDYVWYPAGLGNKPNALVSQIYVTKDINVIGGSNGFASISQLKNTVDQVPEPMTLALLGSGLLLFGVSRYRRRS